MAGLLLAAPTPAENIDPSGDQQQYAWSENGGWVNFEPGGDGGHGVEVRDFELLGWAWGENFGWINFSCRNLRSCDRGGFGVINDGKGNLSGDAWSENLGRINFHPSSGAGVSGVHIDPDTGVFHGDAWSENGGWIRFDFADRGVQIFQVATTWACAPPPPVPGGAPDLSFSLAGGTYLYWTSVPGATGYDIVSGDLGSLWSTGGDFGQAGAACLADNETGSMLEVTEIPAPGKGLWLLGRPANCAGAGTFESPSPPQVGSRDATLGGSVVCPVP